jgi:hypothetical protein
VFTRTRLCYLERWGRNSWAKEEEGSLPSSHTLISPLHLQLGRVVGMDPVLTAPSHSHKTVKVAASTLKVWGNPRNSNPTEGLTNTYWGEVKWWLQIASLLLQDTDLHVWSLVLACSESSLQSAWVWHFTGRWRLWQNHLNVLNGGESRQRIPRCSPTASFSWRPSQHHSSPPLSLCIHVWLGSAHAWLQVYSGWGSEWHRISPICSRLAESHHNDKFSAAVWEGGPSSS